VQLLLSRDLIIAVDLGTTSLKVGVASRDLRILAHATQTYPVHFRHPGWAEQDPANWWRALGLALAQLRGEIDDLPQRVAGIVFSAQLCGVIAADEHGNPLRPCMIWLDKRSAAEIAQVMGGFPSLFGYGAVKLLTSLHLANGAPSLNGMDPPGKMMWIRRHEPEIWARTRKFLDVKDWLVHQACGAFVTTADCANLTWMTDTRPGRNDWSVFLMARFGIRRDQLPDIVEGASSPGGLTAAAACHLGLPEGLPVIAGCGDVCAAALGSGQVVDGELHISLGTSSWIGGFFPGRRLSASEGYATIASPMENRPLLIATQESAGSCIDWLENTLGSRVGRTASGQEAGRSVPLFLPWLAGERVPVDDSRLRGAFLGLSLMHGAESLEQAVIEGIALNTRWAYRSVAQVRGAVSGRPVPVVGGAAQNPALCQALADCLNTAIIVGAAPRMVGVTGAASIAAAHLGFFGDVWKAASSLNEDAQMRYVPDPARAAYFDRRFKLFRDAYRNTAPWMRKFFAAEELER
jgi:xylulokinase